MLPLTGADEDSLRVAGLPEGLGFDPRAGAIARRTRAAGAHDVLITGDGPAGNWTESSAGHEAEGARSPGNGTARVPAISSSSA
jgi:hypothetical protein